MLNNILIITVGLLVVFSAMLGIYIFTRNPRMKINWLWALVNLSITVWAVGYFLISRSDDIAFAASMMKIVYLGASLIPIFYFHGVTTFLIKNIQYKNFIKFGYILAAFWVIVTLTTNLVIDGVRYSATIGYDEIVGPLFFLFLAYFSFYVFYGLYLLFRIYPESSKSYKRKVKFIIIATIIVIFGGMFNFVTNFFEVYPYPMMVVFTYPLFIYYGIFTDGIRIKVLR